MPGGPSAIVGLISIQLEPYRPFFLGLTVVLLGSAFYVTYRPAGGSTCAGNGSGTTSSNRVAKTVLWLTAAVVVLVGPGPSTDKEDETCEMNAERTCAPRWNRARRSWSGSRS